MKPLRRLIMLSFVLAATLLADSLDGAGQKRKGKGQRNVSGGGAESRSVSGSIVAVNRRGYQILVEGEKDGKMVVPFFGGTMVDLHVTGSTRGLRKGDFVTFKFGTQEVTVLMDAVAANEAWQAESRRIYSDAKPPARGKKRSLSSSLTQIVRQSKGYVGKVAGSAKIQAGTSQKMKQSVDSTKQHVAQTAKGVGGAVTRAATAVDLQNKGGKILEQVQQEGKQQLDDSMTESRIEQHRARAESQQQPDTEGTQATATGGTGRTAADTRQQLAERRKQLQEQRMAEQQQQANPAQRETMPETIVGRVRSLSPFVVNTPSGTHLLPIDLSQLKLTFIARMLVDKAGLLPSDQISTTLHVQHQIRTVKTKNGYQQWKVPGTERVHPAQNLTIHRDLSASTQP